MKFLLEILGMTSQCNLRCNYCDWEKDKYFELSEEQKSNMKRNISNIKKVVDREFPEVRMVEYSGGEPFMYPEIVEEILETFPKRWIRIITNGLLMKDEHLEKIKNHGKTFIAISLDGNTLDANYSRFQDNEKIFNKVIENMKKVIEKKIPLMILCTINKHNIDQFASYVEYLEKNYKEEIESGMIVMPSHFVTNYSKENGMPSLEQKNNLIKWIEDDIDKYTIVSSIKSHYQSLAKYMEANKKLHHCKINEWNVCMHFRKNEIVSDGKFLSFRCGMRGVGELGLFNINDDDSVKKYIDIVKDENFLKDFDENIKFPKHDNKYSEYNLLDLDCQSKCFVDWTIIDYIINGYVPYEEAAKWFVMFKDKNVNDFIREYSSGC